MGVPGAGLWTLLVLIMATVQLPTGIILIPSIFYVASIAGTVPTVLYGIWMIMVSLSDNVLKPLLLGRGGTAPMAVIFLGAIGGFLLSGIVGLFVGAIILVLGYRLFMVWFYQDQPELLPEELQLEVSEAASE
jgi:predicted PurR-regulated permease PerM